jgi:hypothetical protein
MLWVARQIAMARQIDVFEEGGKEYLVEDSEIPDATNSFNF